MPHEFKPRQYEPGEIVDVPADVRALADEYLAIQDQVKHLEARKREIAPELCAAVGDAEWGDAGTCTIKPTQRWTPRTLIVAPIHEEALMDAGIPFDERGGYYSSVFPTVTRVKEGAP